MRESRTNRSKLEGHPLDLRFMIPHLHYLVCWLASAAQVSYVKDNDSLGPSGGGWSLCGHGFPICRKKMEKSLCFFVLCFFLLKRPIELPTKTTTNNHTFCCFVSKRKNNTEIQIHTFIVWLKMFYVLMTIFLSATFSINGPGCGCGSKSSSQV